MEFATTVYAGNVKVLVGFCSDGRDKAERDTGNNTVAASNAAGMANSCPHANEATNVLMSEALKQDSLSDNTVDAVN